MNRNYDKENYNPSLIEAYWQKKWEEVRLHSPNLDTAKSPFYNLMMFPYPSAEGLHVGNMYAFTGADIYGRFQRMKGNDVFEPIGLDGFGIHSENYAIKIGKHPKEQAKISEKNFYRQLRATGNGFDWTRTVETYDPKYYKWTQWLFIQLFKAGLAYRKKAPVNFCPSCKTVLADEQVVRGQRNVGKTRHDVYGKQDVILGTQSEAWRTPESPRELRDSGQARMTLEANVCERCGTEVEKKELEQWFFKITKYADRLLDNLSRIDWVEKVKIAQRQWIGKKEGTIIRFKIKDLGFKNGEGDSIDVFTTRSDTLYGATFLVVSPEHPMVALLLNSKFEIRNSSLSEVKSYFEKAKKKTEQERTDEEREKTGVFSGLYAINPLNQEKLPIWIADYALMGYGTGALFGDAHDERDVMFAKKYKIPLKVTVVTGDEEKDKRIKSFEEVFTGEGILIDSGEFTGLTSKEGKKRVTDWLNEHKAGGPEVTYHLRDWLISRQRYWGPPIPMIYCEKCKWQPVPEKDLPVLLPDVKDWKPKGTGKSPLASVESFANTFCPNCKSPAKRETDVSDTFLDSAWYFFRYVSTDIDSIAFDIKRVKLWLPVKMYIGGAEHSVLHLLYSRFITMVLKDLGFIGSEEPFRRFYAHGLILAEGGKMSKSKGNVVVPDMYIKKFGADALRCYLMFLGPFNQGGDFRDSGIEGMHRFLKRFWSLVVSRLSLSKEKSPKTKDQLRFMHRAIKKVTEDVENLHYNTAIASLMEWYNYISNIKDQISEVEIETYLKLLAPFAPHMTEQLFQLLRTQKSKIPLRREASKSQRFESIHIQSWPTYDPEFLKEDEVTIIVQVNGKVRDTIKVKNLPASPQGQKEIEDKARTSEKIKKHLDGKSVKKVIYIEGKVINFVIERIKNSN
ncbi:leucine--tRNA ligase [Candidatus Roizmanbacteria bacterium]|nr:leucine--tRNA ligase [Candidatus Roizmanbacteria bacterium]